MCCSVVQCVAVCCSALQYDVVQHRVHSAAALVSIRQQFSMLQCVAVCCSALQCGTVCCSVLQCVAVCRSVNIVCNQPRHLSVSG